MEHGQGKEDSKMHRTGHATKLPLLMKEIITGYQRFQESQKILHPVFEEQKSVESMNIWSNKTDCENNLLYLQ
jgi:hypothetical protein